MLFSQGTKRIGGLALLVAVALLTVVPSASALSECGPMRLKLADRTVARVQLSDCIRERVQHAIELERVLELADVRDFSLRFAGTELAIVDPSPHREQLRGLHRQLRTARGELEARPQQPASGWVDYVVSLAKLPRLGAVVVQRVAVSFAKILPRVAQAIF